MIDELVTLQCEGRIRFLSLDLSYNNIVGDYVCDMLQRLIEAHTPLKTLILDGTQITQKGLAKLIMASERSTNISSISVKKCTEIDL